MGTKLLAVLSVVVGGIGAVIELLVAFGVDVTQPQQNAIGRVAALLLLVVGAWLHPAVPVGVKKILNGTVQQTLTLLAIVVAIVMLVLLL